MSKNGFTLVELLIVVAIMGVLTTVGFVSYQNIRNKAQDIKKKEDLDAIKKAYETKFIANGQTVYLPLAPGDFADNRIPTQPNGSPYPCLIGPDTGCTNYSNQGYQVSGTLSSGSSYTVTADQGTLSLSCSNLTSPQVCRVWIGTAGPPIQGVPLSVVAAGGTIYINCSDISAGDTQYYRGVLPMDCSIADEGQSTPRWVVPYYYTQKIGGTRYNLNPGGQTNTIWPDAHNADPQLRSIHVDLHIP